MPWKNNLTTTTELHPAQSPLRLDPVSPDFQSWGGVEAQLNLKLKLLHKPDLALVPDITVFAWDRIPLNESGDVENQFNTYPDWTIEILSPDQSPTRIINNILFCLNHGTRLGWLIDPEERTVITFQPNQQPLSQTEDTDRLMVLDLMGTWEFTIGELFSLLSFGPR